MRSQRTIGALLSAAVIAAVAASTVLGAGHRPAARPPSPTATPAPTATATPCSGCPTMHVDSVNINAWENGTSRTLQAGCYVAVKDASGGYVSGALVTVQWGGQLAGTATALTALTGGEGGYAEAYFFNSVSGRCRSGDIKLSSCTVRNVYKDGMAYEPAQNVQDTDSNDHCHL